MPRLVAPWVACSLLVLSVGSLALAKDPADKIPLGPPVATLEDVQNHPGDAKKLSRFAAPLFREIGQLIDEQPDAAEKKRAEFEATLTALEPTGDAVKMRASIVASIKFMQKSIALSRLSLADVEKALVEKPDDEEAFRNWQSKALGAVSELSYVNPDEAEAKLKSTKEFIAKIAAAAQDEKTKTRIEGLSKVKKPRGAFLNLEDSIKKGREYAALIGQDATPLRLNTWVNGQPVTPEELKGKVVLLDFFAIWCGPCIVTFPHLREWQEKYGERGLAIVGVTRYYDYKWDDQLGYVVPPEMKKKEGADNEEMEKEDVPPEVERQMLEKFAAYYHLKHPFGIQEEGDDSLKDFYSVRGIPHVVVIDQQHKIRLIRVGSGKESAAAIEKLLAELLK